MRTPWLPRRALPAIKSLRLLPYSGVGHVQGGQHARPRRPQGHRLEAAVLARVHQVRLQGVGVLYAADVSRMPPHELSLTCTTCLEPCVRRGLR